MQTKKEVIQEILKRGECEFIFIKVNGEERQANGTLHPDYLPQIDWNDSENRSNETEDTVTYWDLDANNWRRFRIDSLTYGPVVTEEIS